MARQYLIPAKSVDDATNAISQVPSTAEAGDEIVVLIISEVPEGELTGSRPPATVLDPLATTGGVSSEPRAGADRPQFLGREEIMEIKSREILEALNPQLERLHDQGFGARGETMFSDEPGPVIIDYAGDIDANSVVVTPEFYSELDAETQKAVRSL